MLKHILTKYLSDLQKIIDWGDAREESFYHCLKDLLETYARENRIAKCEVTILPKATEAGNPDFRIWDGKNHITGYIEAKKPEQYNLESISVSEQLKRYLGTFPNLILTNFYEFWLYQHGDFVCSATIASAINATQMRKAPPLSQIDEFEALFDRYFSFSLPAITDPKSLANALAKRTRFLRDEIIAIELAEEEKQGRKVLLGFYESFKKLLINNLTLDQFADLYAQTLTYGIFAARTRSTGEFNRELIHKYIPNTLGILKSIFKFISYEEPPKALEVLIDDIAEILCVTDIQQILHKYYQEGKGSDPIIHFYETFLSEYDPSLREKRGVYYTPEPVVGYIVRSIHSLLKSHFGLADGLASPEVTILDPAAGTLTFPAEAIKVAISEHSEKYGSGGIHKLIKEHILPHFHAIELMMAPYTVGHLKISYLLAEHGYEMADDERFKLYLSNTLEPDTPMQTELPITHDISEECALANKVKHQDPILVIMGNPPYSGASENSNAWTEKLLKTDLDGAQSYYTIDSSPLGERNPKWLQDDYVKFLRFAQWKIHKAGRGIVGMITNHGYLDNPTFRGMRQSLMNTFDEIYVLDLHGNSLKKEKAPDGGKDDNVFDIQQGTAIVLMIKSGKEEVHKVAHHELFGLRTEKYDWLEANDFKIDTYEELNPSSPFYLFHPEATGNEHYLEWTSLPEIFPVNSVGIVTARDALTIQDSENQVRKTVHHFASLEAETARTTYRLGKDAQDWKVDFAQRDLNDSDLSDDRIKPILYRPFDTRYTYYTGINRGFHCRPRNAVMKHMLEDNVGISTVRQVKSSDTWQHVLLSNGISESCYISNKTSEISYVFPLYLYPDEHNEDIFASTEREYNIAPELIDRFSKLWPDFEPEQLFYYIYAILHSNSYRERYAQYLRMDFPRIPFTEDYALFEELAELGQELSAIHLLKSPLLDPPLAKYQGSGTDDTVDFYKFDSSTGRVQINEHKYFEGISQELWDYHIGGYQVLHKYLKDRKGKSLTDPIHYCRMVTALAKTIELQDQVDEVYIQLDPINESNEQE
ncbi:MAG: N-6 DNA methylase [Candidatus Cloacimonetes bacterium]|nr:N-6 DNA methylase [Candidatus Cloacimonadota bacterium]MDY0173271.1 type ISP restriction/modification enzyme [Candidatus Cloacimonadaceae bacterium]